MEQEDYDVMRGWGKGLGDDAILVEAELDRE